MKGHAGYQSLKSHGVQREPITLYIVPLGKENVVIFKEVNGKLREIYSIAKNEKGERLRCVHY